MVFLKKVVLGYQMLTDSYVPLSRQAVFSKTGNTQILDNM